MKSQEKEHTIMLFLNMKKFSYMISSTEHLLRIHTVMKTESRFNKVI